MECTNLVHLHINLAGLNVGAEEDTPIEHVKLPDEKLQW